jgi:hypothetical protein
MASTDGIAKAVSVGSEPPTGSGSLLLTGRGNKMSSKKQRVIRPCPICRGGRDKRPKIPCWSCLDRGTIADILDRETGRSYRRNYDS